MRIDFHKQFKKEYIKLTPQLQKKADKAIAKFTKNPMDITLRNHALAGRLKGKRSISVTGDLRIIFAETDNDNQVIFLRIGTHNQVY